VSQLGTLLYLKLDILETIRLGQRAMSASGVFQKNVDIASSEEDAEECRAEEIM
jgi:hypothetical protein